MEAAGSLFDIYAMVEFYETASRNRGFDVRVFADRDKAIDWLTRAG
jgi:hypothetical protein